MTDTQNTPRKEPRSALDTVFSFFEALFSPLTLLGGAGFVLGVWGTFEFGLPIYAAIVGLAIGLVLGFVYRIFNSLF